jgi:hypothetical protein
LQHDLATAAVQAAVMSPETRLRVRRRGPGESGPGESGSGADHPIFTLFDDHPPSVETRRRSLEMKHWVEEYYWEFLSYQKQRVDRQRRLERRLSKATNKFATQALIRAATAEENAILRSRRLCGRMDDFKFLKRIGKGAFGE